MNAKKLATVVELHGKYRRGEEGGERADLRGANLRCAYLGDAHLRDANLSGFRRSERRDLPLRGWQKGVDSQFQVLRRIGVDRHGDRHDVCRDRSGERARVKLALVRRV